MQVNLVGLGDNNSPQRAKVHSIIPYIVRQLLTAEGEDVISIDNCEINKVIVVGQIQSLHEVSGKTSFMINDGTSSIDAIIWDEQEESSQKQWRREGCYVRVIGVLQKFNHKMSLVVYAIFPLEDSNEITYHLANSLYVHLEMRMGPPMQKNLTHPSPFGGHSRIQETGESNPSLPSNQISHQNYGQSAAIAETVKKILEINQTAEGMGFDELTKGLVAEGVTASDNQARSALEELLEDAAIYTTIDDYHWKVC